MDSIQAAVTVLFLPAMSLKDLVTVTSRVTTLLTVALMCPQPHNARHHQLEVTVAAIILLGIFLVVNIVEPLSKLHWGQ